MTSVYGFAKICLLGCFLSMAACTPVNFQPVGVKAIAAANDGLGTLPGSASGTIPSPAVTPPTSGDDLPPSMGSGSGASVSNDPPYLPPVPSCRDVRPSWLNFIAPVPQQIRSADAAKGLLPPIQTKLMIARSRATPAFPAGGGPTLDGSKNGVYPVLISCASDCHIVQSWDNAQFNLDFAQRLFFSQTFQLQASGPLAAGDYYLAIVPAGLPADPYMIQTNSGNAIAPMSSATTLATRPTFTVDGSGQVVMGSDPFTVIVDAMYADAYGFVLNPTYDCVFVRGTGGGSDE